MPSASGQGPTVLSRAAEHLLAAFVELNELVVRRIVFDLHLAGHRLAVICDEVIAEAMHRIGDLWERGELEVYVERRACQLCHRALFSLQRFLPAPQSDAPRAVGGAPEGDPYTLPTRMVELVLQQNGWRATSLGSSLPTTTLRAAWIDLRPTLSWLSVSHVDHPDVFPERFAAVQESATAVGATLVVGGRGLTRDMRNEIRGATYRDNLVDFESFLQSGLPTLHEPVSPSRTAACGGDHHGKT